MYLSKYYTCEEIDQRLLQGYYDDFVKAGFVGTIQEFWAFVLSITNKVDKVEGYGLSKNDFTDELLEKLNGIEEHANYVTKLSQLENDTAYQTEDQVKKLISDLVDGADDALDTLKELAEALGNDPNFATTITNKLTDLRNELLEEVSRAKDAEATLDNKITQLNSDLTNAFKDFEQKLTLVIQGINDNITKLGDKLDTDIANLAAYKTEMATTIAETQAQAKSYTDAETNRAKEAEATLAQADHDLKVQHTKDKAELQAAIANETSAREQGDQNITNSLAEEQQARIQEDAAIRKEFADADQQIKDNYVPWTPISTSDLPNRKAIVLPSVGDVILATTEDGQTRSLAQYSKWGVVDFGIPGKPFNINTAKDTRPTIQEEGQSGDQAHKMAYLSDVQKWFGSINIPNQYWNAATIQLIPSLEQSYIDDLGNPDTINGNPFDSQSNTYVIGNPYLALAYFDEALVMHYHLYTAGNAQYIGQVFYAMMEYAKQNQEDHENIRKEIQDSQSNQDNLKEELLQEIQKESQARQEADTKLDEEKVDKREGYDLSKNDFTDELLAKLNGIEEGANKITALSQLLNDCDFQNSTQVNEAIQKIIGSAPEVLDTLEEIAKALGDDPNFAATITKKLAALAEDINDEAQAREDADTQLQTNIDNLGTQTDTKLTQLSNQFQTKIDTEAQARKDSDAQLQANITAEAQERQTADTALDNRITAEATNRQSADQSLQEQITALASQLGQAGSSLKDYVDNIRTQLETKIDANTALINTNTANIQRNLQLIQALQEQYNKIDTTWKELQTAMEQEIQDRKDADAQLQANIDKVSQDLVTETANREAADEALQANIDKLQSDTETAIQELTEKHDQEMAQEVSDRQAADKAIQDQIDTFPDNIRVDEAISAQDASKIVITHTYKYKDAEKKYTGQSTKDITLSPATTTLAGLMSAEDKNKLEKVIVDLEKETTHRTAQDEILQGNIDTLTKTHQDDVESLKNLLHSQDQRISQLESQVAELIAALTLK